MGAAPAKKNGLPYLSFSSDRRFGLELELLSFDGKNRPEAGQKPAGIDHVAMIVSQNSEEGTDIREWEHTNGNDQWVIKPDSSCGMEVCTPIFKGWTGVRKCCEVVKAFSEDSKIKIDQRCSVHIHIEVSDLEQSEIAAIIAHWFKIEPVVMDAMPVHRKRNRYCQFMGMTNLVEHDTKIGIGDLIKLVGNVKYFSFNTNQMVKNGRKTVEFRTIEGEGVKDPYLIKNWIRFIINFVEMARKKSFPPPYKEGDPFSSFLWLDVEDTLKFLGFSDNPQEYELSSGLKQTRNWFLARLQKYMCKDVKEIECGPRSYAYKELQLVLERFRKNGINITSEEHLTPSDLKDALFNEETKI